MGKNKKIKTEAEIKYDKKVKEVSPGSPIVKDCAKAFFFGGLICLIGEMLFNLYKSLGVSEKNCAAGVSVTAVESAAAESSAAGVSVTFGSGVGVGVWIVKL